VVKQTLNDNSVIMRPINGHSLEKGEKKWDKLPQTTEIPRHERPGASQDKRCNYETNAFSKWGPVIGRKRRQFCASRKRKDLKTSYPHAQITVITRKLLFDDSMRKITDGAEEQGRITEVISSERGIFSTAHTTCIMDKPLQPPTHGLLSTDCTI